MPNAKFVISDGFRLNQIITETKKKAWVSCKYDYLIGANRKMKKAATIDEIRSVMTAF